MATKRRSSAKKARRGGKKRGGAKLKSSRRKGGPPVIIELRPADRSVSPYGQRVLGIFRKRVTAALRDFENRQIEVVVQTRDGIVRGIPRREDGAVLVGDKIVSS